MARPDPNDITQFKKPTKTGVLDAAAAPTPAPAPKPTPAPKAAKPKQPATTKKKKSTEPRREKVTIYFTEAEKEHLAAEAGMVPLTKHLIMKMQEAGIIPREK